MQSRAPKRPSLRHPARQQRRRSPRILATSAAVLFSLSLLAGSAHGAPDDWFGGNSASWDDSGNWSPGLPTPTSQVSFPNSVPATGSTITLTNDVADTITFNSGYTLTGGTLTLTTGTIQLLNGLPVTINSVLSGSNGISVTGGGSVTFGGNNTYTGPTNIGGLTVLYVNGSISASSTVTVNNGAQIGGSGTIPGTVNVLSGGTILPGPDFTIGTVTVGNLVLNSGSIAEFRLAQAGTVGGGVNDLVNVTGSLTLTGASGNLLVFPQVGFTTGTYELFTYGGGLSGSSALTIQGVPAGDTGMLVAGGGQVNLVVIAAQYWDGSSTTATGSVQGGSGTWDNSTTNWTDSTGSTNSAWQGSAAMFNAPGGTVTLGAPISAQALIFGATGYVINGTSTNNLTLTGAAPTITVTNSTDTATINAPIAGTNGLAVSGAGTLVLTGANTYTGATHVAGGTLQIGNGTTGSIDSTSAVTVDSGATLALNLVSGGTFANSITNNGTVSTSGKSASVQTLSGQMSGMGVFLATGFASTILTNVNTYQGGTTVESLGTLQVGTNFSAATVGSGPVTIEQGTLQLTNVSGGAFANDVSGINFSGTVSNSLSTSTITVTGSITDGTGSLQVVANGSGGTLILTSAGNTYSGSTTISNNSTLQIGTSAAAGSVGTQDISLSAGGTLNIVNLAGNALSNPIENADTGAGHVVVNSANTNTISSAISDIAGGISIDFTQNGPGTTILTAANGYSGATTVNGGALVVNGSLASASAVSVNSGGTLAGSGNVQGSVNVASGGTLNPGPVGGTTPGTLTVGSLVLNFGSNSNFRLAQAGTVGGVNDLVQVTGNLTLGGSVNITALTTLATGSYPLFTYGGSESGSFNFLVLPGGDSGSIVVAGGEVSLMLTAAASSYTWTGATNGNWSSGGNWSPAAVPPANSDLTFAGSTQLNPNNDLSAYVANTISFASGAGAFTLNGNALSVAAGITNNSSNTQKLSFGGTGITLNASQTWNANTAALWITSNVALNGNTLTIVGGGLNFGVLPLPDLSTEIDGNITGSGGLTIATNYITGPGGAVYLTGDNTYTGQTLVQSNSFLIVSGASNHALSGSGVVVQSGATLSIQSGSDGGSVPTSIIGTGVDSQGAIRGGTFFATGNSQYDGAISLAGDATIDTVSGTLFTLTGGINTQGHTLTLGSSSTGGNSDVIAITTTGISGAGSVLVDTESATLSVTSTYTGPTTIINGATLNASVSGALPAPATDGGTGTVRSDIFMDQTGSGSSVLNLGANQAISSLTGTATSKVTLATNTLTIGNNNASITLFAGVISGTGGITKDGNSLQTLAGANTYIGTTAVNGGTLVVNGSLASASAVSVNSGGTLAGTGTVAGTVNVFSGGTLQPGDPTTGNPGTITVGNLVLNAGSNSNFRLAQANLVTPGGGINDLVNVTGNLTLGGSLNITQLSGFSTGSYTLYTYGGLESGSFTSINGLPGGDTGTIVTGVSGQISLTVAPSGLFSQYWDGGGSPNDGIVSGGSGTWDNSTNNWTIASGNTNSAWQSSAAVFEGPSGTVTLGAPISAQTVIFGTTGYVINGSGSNTLTLTGATPNIIVTNATDTATINATIAGTVGLTKGGAGTLILTGTNTYTGGTMINAGTLQIGNGSGTVSLGSGNIVDNGTLVIDGGNLFSLPNISGTGALTITGGGSYVFLSGSNTYSGTTTIATDTILQVGGGGTVGTLGTGNVVDNGTLIFARSDTLNVPNVISGSGGLEQFVAGTTVLSGLNTYTGGTDILTGVVQAGSTQAFGVNSGVTVFGTLDLHGFSNSIGYLDANSSGGIVDNTVSTPATLTIGGGSLSGTFEGIIQNSGGGALSLVKIGLSTQQTLTGANTYTGTTTINGGVLEVDGSLAAASAVTVNSGGTLAGSGTVAGAVNVASGGTLNPGPAAVGSTPGTLAVGSLVLNPGAISNFRLAQANLVTPGGGINDLVNVTGNLTLGGTLNITQLSGFSTGSYTLYTYGGSESGSFSAINGLSSFNVAISTAVPNQVILTVSPMAITTQYWDGNGSPNDGVISGGSGTWDNSTSNWTNSTGTSNTTWQGNTAVFAAPGGTVTLGAPISAQTLIFGSTGYTIASASNALTLTGAATINVTNAGTTATISAPIAGSAGLNVTGAGTLILTNSANNFSGNVSVSGATLQVGTIATAGSLGTGISSIGISNSGTLSVVNNSGSSPISTNISNGVGGVGTLLVNSANSFTFSGTLADGTAGTLAVTQSGTGTTVLSGTNAYSGATTVSGGKLQAGSTQAFGVNSRVSLPASGGTLDLNGFSNSIGSLNGVVGSTVDNTSSSAATLTTGSLNGSDTFNGVIQNSGGALSLTKVGAGTQVLTGNNTYTGATTVSAGTLQVGNGTSGNLTGTSGVTVANNATLATNLASGATFSPNVNLNGASAAFNAIQSGTNTIASLISGTGVFNQNGTGTTILTAMNTYSGATTVNNGALEVNGSIANSATTVTSLGTLQGVGIVGSVINNGTVAPGSTAGGPGTLTVNGNYTQGSGGNLRIGLVSTSTFGKLAVMGTATLNGSVTAYSVGSFTPQVGNSFQVVSASSVSGTFSNVVDQTHSAGTLVQLQAKYSSTGATLQFIQGSIPIPPISGGGGSGGGSNSGSGNIPDLGFNGNGLTIARDINGDLNDPRLAPVLKFLDKLPLSSLPAALDRISPDELSALTTASSSLSNTQVQNIQTRLEALISGISGATAQGMHLAGDGPDYAGNFTGSGLEGPNGAEGKESKEAPPYNPRLGTFITGAGEWVTVGNTDNARGYDLVTGGFTLGVDYKLTDSLAIGIDAGYAHTGIDLENGGRSTIDAGSVGLYGTYFTGGFYADGAVTGTYNGYDNRRAGLQGDAYGQTHGGAIDALLATGYNWHLGGLTLGPTGSFRYNYTQIEDYSEHGSLAPMSFPTQGTDSIRSAFGGKATYDWHAGGVVIRPELSLAWQHEYGRTNPGVIAEFASGAGSQFTVFGPDTGRDSLLLGAGFAVIWSDRFSSYLYYDGELARTNYDMNSITGGLRMTF